MEKVQSPNKKWASKATENYWYTIQKEMNGVVRFTEWGSHQLVRCGLCTHGEKVGHEYVTLNDLDGLDPSAMQPTRGFRAFRWGLGSPEDWQRNLSNKTLCSVPWSRLVWCWNQRHNWLCLWLEYLWLHYSWLAGQMADFVFCKCNQGYRMFYCNQGYRMFYSGILFQIFTPKQE